MNIKFIYLKTCLPDYIFISVFLIKVTFCKYHQKHNSDSKSLEGDTLIDKILAADKFHELADKIVNKAVEKINNQQSAVTIQASKNPGIETKKSNANPNPDFKSLEEKKNGKLEKKSKKSQKRLTYKPGKIDTVAVMQKKILPSNNLALRYYRFTRKNRAITVSDNPLAEQKNTVKANLNVENENEESTSKHQVIKKPSADGNSEEQSKSRTEEESNSEANERDEKTTPNKSRKESTKFSHTVPTRITNQDNENPYGNEKAIVWNGKQTDNDANDSEDKSSDEDKQNGKQNTLDVTKEITSEKETTKMIHSFRAETVFNSTTVDKKVNEVDDHSDYENDNLENIEVEQKDTNNKAEKNVRREGNTTYILRDSSDYKDYHEQLAKLRKFQP